MNFFQRVDDHLAGHITLGVPTHAISHHPQADFRPFQKRVFIVFTDLANVRKSKR